jgi:hypothetical protein
MCSCAILGSIGCAILGIVLIIVVVYIKTHQDQVDALKQKVDNVIPDVPKIINFGDLFQFDPFKGKKDVNHWPNAGTGFHLTLLNALEPEWNQYFYKSITQWDNGEPDTMTLYTDTRPYPQHNCTTEEGYLKVCNGNYGATQWVGATALLMNGKNGNITSAYAKMNEYYIFSRNGSIPIYGTNETNLHFHRQYTMCHEVGHGLGLPHTDEDFYNKDTGNCLDITNTPENNMQPDRENFITLKKEYGKMNDQEDNPYTATEKSGDSGNRLLKNNEYDSSTIRHVHAPIQELPNWINDAINEINTNFVHVTFNQRRRQRQRQRLLKVSNGRIKGHRVLQETKRSEHHEFDIGNEYYVQVSFLMSYW